MVSQTNLSILPRPFLKWAGGKSKLIQQYQAYFPKIFKTYYEPFLGGGAVFFHLQPFNAILMDINAELINTYCCVRDHVEPLIERLAEHQSQHDSTYYYQMRSSLYSTSQQNQITSAGSLTNEADIERAAKFIYLNKTCFNGLYRENSKGQFNVPIGSYKNPQICQPDVLRSASACLKLIHLKVQPFANILELAKTSDDFVYFDPPYHPLNQTSNFTAYSRYSFSEADQINLCDIFMQLSDRGVKLMLSNSDCPFIRKLYSSFKIHTISAPRSINSQIKKRGRVSELLVTSNLDYNDKN